MAHLPRVFLALPIALTVQLACAFVPRMLTVEQRAATIVAETAEAASPTPTQLPPTATPSPTSTATPTETPSPTATPGGPGIEPSGGVLFRDDFDDASSGWEVGDYVGGSVGYQHGAYFVRALGQSNTMWGRAGTFFNDVFIRVEASQVEAPANGNNDYGVICRLQDDGSGYYLLIAGDGFFSILTGIEERFEPLAPWTLSQHIRKGNSTNDIIAICAGESLSLYVNGFLLANVQDDRFSGGDIGLTATTYEEESTLVLFDNLVVSQP